MKHSIDCVGFKPLRKGTLVGFAEIVIRELKLTLRRWPAREGQTALGLAPGRPWVRDGAVVVGGNGADREDWCELVGNIIAGIDLHRSITVVAAKMIADGKDGGLAVNILRGLMQHSRAREDRPDEWRDRCDYMPRAVSSAQEKFGKRNIEAPGTEGEPIAPNPQRSRPSSRCSQVASVEGRDAGLRDARHGRCQFVTRRSGLARPDRTALVGQDRTAQFDI